MTPESARIVDGMQARQEKLSQHLLVLMQTFNIVATKLPLSVSRYGAVAQVEEGYHQKLLLRLAWPGVGKHNMTGIIQFEALLYDFLEVWYGKTIVTLLK